MLVLDNNIFFSLMNPKSVNSYLFSLAKIKFVAPEFLKSELDEHKSECLAKSALSKHEFEIIQIGYDKYDTPFRGFYDVIGSLYLPLYKKISNWRKTKAQKNPQEASGFEIIAQKK